MHQIFFSKIKVTVTCGGKRILLRGRDRKKGYEGYLPGKKKTDYRKLMEKRKVELCQQQSLYRVL